MATAIRHAASAAFTAATTAVSNKVQSAKEFAGNHSTALKVAGLATAALVTGGALYYAGAFSPVVTEVAGNWPWSAATKVIGDSPVMSFVKNYGLKTAAVAGVTTAVAFAGKAISNLAYFKNAKAE